MFQTKGIITYDAQQYTEEEILEAALELGAEDISNEDGVIEVLTDPSDFSSVLEGLQAADFKESSAKFPRSPTRWLPWTMNGLRRC